ncbi:alanine racemase [Nocardioides terrisoli]|uniref:alanine racemase n=1 Tax=Nocardioides terrisoli TaxID=3388267 RepID=UPI00287B8FFA|nr:alanine racemase [Nocardioides marmorisolisilvae]
MTSPAAPRPRAEIVVDLDAIRHNVRRLREQVVPAAVMVVVKADGYGHGMVPVARAAREAGADWLGAATLPEAVALREAGDEGRLMCWLAAPGEDYDPALRHDIDVSASTVEQLAEIAEAAARIGTTARVHLKFDTGLTRGGSARADWQRFIAAAVELPHLDPVGVWSHLACADEPDHPANDAQERAFREVLAMVEEAGLHPEVRHLANSAGGLLRPSIRFDLVRFGIASYGLTPAPAVASSAALGLAPAMTVRGSIVLGKDVAAGDGISYGHTYVAPAPMHVGLVPMGYGDGIPRHASSTAQVQVNGRRADVLGRICMDQFVVDAPDAQAGDEVVLFGPGDDGEPTAQEWADWCDTISYEIVTRMGGRQQRVWVGR